MRHVMCAVAMHGKPIKIAVVFAMHSGAYTNAVHAVPFSVDKVKPTTEWLRSDCQQQPRAQVVREGC